MPRVLGVAAAGFLLVMALGIVTVLAGPESTCAATAGCPNPPGPPANCEPADLSKSSLPPWVRWTEEWQGTTYWCAEL